MAKLRSVSPSGERPRPFAHRSAVRQDLGHLQDGLRGRATGLGQVNSLHKAAPHAVANRDRAASQLDDLAGDGETKPRTRNGLLAGMMLVEMLTVLVIK